MTIADDHMDLSVYQAALVCTLRPGQLMSRAAFGGQPFRVEREPWEPIAPPQLYPEALVLEMIGLGLLDVLQGTQEWERAPARPYTVRLSAAGVRERGRLYAAGIGQKARAA
ncbi:hypothetical protein E4M02_11010 [Brevundimonas sp. S30B]|uniref:hypothetical protein n=1 Tax=unclassified Brevundimonas TaxID=2622653 RepID=UPI001071C09A|nr:MULTISPECIES: hypothetical protein [unclassified Brevundimonas]QBX38643.1 hypothetical protein E4M01_13270 [Brevundimonas sp. MF30-B]TFW01234.1 hypothetical protein E4M02_11010 [Brevundimonas sp. S30B]